MTEPTEPTCRNCRWCKPYLPGCRVAMGCHNPESKHYLDLVHRADTCDQYEPAETKQ